MAMKQILFNTKMVRAILDGRKTVTRRLIHPQPQARLCYICMGNGARRWAYPSQGAQSQWGDNYAVPENLPEEELCRLWTPPCRTDDVLWVRETFSTYRQNGQDFYIYKVYDRNKKLLEEVKNAQITWEPSVQMPREAARIFLRVTNVRVEHLQDIMERGERSAKVEGYINDIDLINGTGKSATRHFSEAWDSTIRPKDRGLYGWEANPWVWVISFKRISQDEVSKEYEAQQEETTALSEM